MDNVLKLAHSSNVHLTVSSSTEQVIENHYFNAKATLISNGQLNEFPYVWYEFSSNLQTLLCILLENRGRGRIYCQSKDQSIYCLPNGMLILFLSKIIYEKAGLTGTKETNGYRVSIDTANEKFKAGEAFYDRVLWCFSHTLTMENDVSIICWDNESVELSFPSSVKPMRQLIEISDVVIENIKVPLYLEGLEMDQEGYLALLEWNGLVCIESPRVSSLDKVDSFICFMEEIEPYKIQSIQLQKISGFLIPEYLSLLSNQANEGWQILTVQKLGKLGWKDAREDRTESFVLVKSVNQTFCYQCKG